MAKRILQTRIYDSKNLKWIDTSVPVKQLLSPRQNNWRVDVPTRQDSSLRRVKDSELYLVSPAEATHSPGIKARLYRNAHRFILRSMPRSCRNSIFTGHCPQNPPGSAGSNEVTRSLPSLLKAFVSSQTDFLLTPLPSVSFETSAVNALACGLLSFLRQYFNGMRD
jgi:hypothetical protein